MFDLNIRFQIAALLVWLLIVIDYNRNPHLKLLSTKFFRTFLIFTGLNLLMDVGSVFTITHLNTIPAWENRLMHQFFIGSVILLLFCNYLYIEILANDQKRPKNRKLFMMMIPLVVSGAMILFGKLNYHISEEAAYSYGPMAYAVYACGFLYLMMSFFITIDKKTSLNQNQRGSIQIGLIIWAATLIVQIIFPRLLLSGLGCVLLVLCVYFSFENQKENYDALTDCFNLNAFHRMVSEYIEKGEKPFLLSITCDNLEQMNVILGHNAGAESLKYMKRIFSTYVLTDIFHARTNFLSTFQKIRPDETMLQQLNQELHEIEFDGVKARCHITLIDLSRFARKKDDVYELLSFMADDLRGKESGIYELDEALVEKKNRRDTIEQLVNDGLDADGFEMFYQPIYNTIEKTFSSAEALLRLKDTETVGFVSPEEFIPIAENKGMMVALGDRVFELVAQDIKRLRMQEHGLHYIEVNLSRMQTVTLGIAEHLIEILSEYDVPVSFINVEITETASVSSEEVLLTNMRQLQAAGFELSMDDFGTGYSNIAQINQIHYELVKLDKSLIWPAFDEKADETDRENAKQLLAMAIGMLKSMHVKIVAEGVETKEMADYLIEQRVEYLQGYYYSRPVTGAKFMEFITNSRSMR